MKQLDPHWFHHEEENWKDYKIRGCDVRFPQHNDTQCSEVTITYIDKK